MLRRLMVEIFRRLPNGPRMWVVRKLSLKMTLGVMVLLSRPDGRFLLVQQRYRAKLFLPGGIVRRGETLVAAAARELREETGLTDCSLTICGEPGHSPRARWLTVYLSGTVTDAQAERAIARGAEITSVHWVDFSRVTPDQAGDVLDRVDSAVYAALRLGLGQEPRPGSG